MQKLKTFWNWLVVSSEDPSKVALTVKGFLGTLISILVLVSPLVHLRLGADQLNTIADGLIKFIFAIASLVSAVAMLLGLIRKLYITKNGL